VSFVPQVNAVLDLTMTNKDFEDAKFFNTFAHSGTRWDRNPTCWRYMDLLSLLAILQNETIHFTHIMDLYRYDPHEGTGGLLINVVNDPIRPNIMVSFPDSRIDEQNRKEIEGILAELQIPPSVQLPKFREKVKYWDKENDSIYISSWHTNEIDSDFMWRIYGKYEYGFAVVSSVQDLVSSISDVSLDLSKIGFGFVVYPTRDQLIRDKLEDLMGSFAAFMIKSPQYSPENEFRVFVRAKKRVDSCDLKVNLRRLVHSIRISPLVPRWAMRPLLETLNPLCIAKGLPPVESGIGSLREI
jgi:hypothetical protein